MGIYERDFDLSKSKKVNVEGFQCICTRVILIDSVYRKDENYCPKGFLEKYNFNDDIEICSDESYNVDSDDSEKKFPVMKIQIKKIKVMNLLLEKAIDLSAFIPKCQK